jgi:two-component system nitrogen regulation response regulator GlnG
MGAILLIEDNTDVQELIAKILPQNSLRIRRTDRSNQERVLEALEAQSGEKVRGLTIEAAVRDALKGESGLSEMGGGVHEKIMGRVEKALIGTVLEEEKGNQVRAAKRLGINRNTLRKKVKDLQISLRFNLY